jgi:GT2 family glycosyltransferase/glycosyltransferase involved in cell wall biosynthesis
MQRTLSVIIPTRGKLDLVQRGLRALIAHVPDGVVLDTVLVEHGGTLCQNLGTSDGFARANIKWIAAPETASYSEMNNLGVAAAEAGTPLLFMNNDVVPQAGCVAAMLAVLDAHADVGVAGAKLLHNDGTIQHLGVAFGIDGVPHHVGWGRDPETFAPATRNDYYDCVTFALALVRREVWDDVGGLCPEYFFNYEDIDFCLSAREKGWRCYVDMAATALHDEGASASDRNTKDHGQRRNWDVLVKRWVTGGRIKKALGLPLSGRMFSHQASASYNVAFLPWVRGGGVTEWRLEAPARKIAKKKLMNTVLVYGDMPSAQVIETLASAHVAVMHGFTDDWISAIAKDKSGRPFAMVYDYDDHPLHISPYAQAYASFGTKEIYMVDTVTGDREWLWRDGQNRLDLQRNRVRLEKQMSILANVDCVTTSTAPLAGFFKTLNANVKVLPNAIDFDLYRDWNVLWERKTSGRIRIGWHGGDNHWHDISQIGPALTAYVNAHDVELVLFGAFYRGPFKGIDESKVVEEDWVHIQAFPHKLAALGIDIAVVPLANPDDQFMEFNRHKSGIKYLEYAALRIPSLVAGGRDAYDMCVNGSNALTYDSDEEFEAQLDRLVRDSKLRKSIGSAAFDYVKEFHDLDKNIYEWCDLYSSLAETSAASRIEQEALLSEPKDLDLRGASSNAAGEGAIVIPFPSQAAV